jgi:hypothetical protein
MRKLVKTVLDHRIPTFWVAGVALLLLLFLFRPTSLGFLIVAIVLIVIVIGAVLRESTAEGRHSVEGLAAFLSTIALLCAGYWYFVERPGVPKLNVEPTVEIWPLSQDMAFARVSLSPTNVGNTAIRLGEQDLIQIEIGQVNPPAGKQAQDLQAAFAEAVRKGDGATQIMQTDKWPLRAGITDGLSSIIESGETERLFYKAVIECHDGLRVAVTAKVPKRLGWFESLFEEDDSPKVWISQELSNSITSCGGDVT